MHAHAERTPASSLGASTIETRFIRFRLSPETGRCEILDRQTGVTWRSKPDQPRFGQVTLNVGGQQQLVSLDRCQVRRSGDALEVTFQPLADRPTAWLRVRVRPSRQVCKSVGLAVCR